jgi:uncharacterized protein (DUF2384 family)
MTLSRKAREKLGEFGKTYEHALRLYRGDVDRMMGFMQRPHLMLDGKTPLQLAMFCSAMFCSATFCSAGADAVADQLNRVEAGFTT